MKLLSNALPQRAFLFEKIKRGMKNTKLLVFNNNVCKTMPYQCPIHAPPIAIGMFHIHAPFCQISLEIVRTGIHGIN